MRNNSLKQLKVTKTMYDNMKPPFGECSDYSENRPFNSQMSGTVIVNVSKLWLKISLNANQY